MSAREAGIISDVAPLLHRLRDEYRFWISDKLLRVIEESDVNT